MDTNTVPLFDTAFTKFTSQIHAPTDFDDSDTLYYPMITISDGTIDVPMASSSGRDNTMLKNCTFDVIALFSGVILSLTLEVAIGTSMMLSDIVMIGYYKISETSKSVGAFILIVKLCT